MGDDPIRAALEAAAEALPARLYHSFVWTPETIERSRRHSTARVIIAFLRALQHDTRIRNLQSLADAVERCRDG